MDYAERYQKLLSRWTTPVTVTTIETAAGPTRVNVTGDGPPLVLMNGGLTTSAVWFDNVAALAGVARVYAVDRGDGSRPEALRYGSPDGVVAWLDEVLDGLGVDKASFAGHSIGGWMSLRYALDRPARTGRMILLDPSLCFAPAALGYRLHAIPMFVRPTQKSARRFFEWETRSRPVDVDAFDLMIEGALMKNAPVGFFKRMTDAEVSGLSNRTLLVLAGRGRSQDARRVERTARRLVADLTVATLMDATHHTIPTEDADELNRLMTSFLSRDL